MFNWFESVSVLEFEIKFFVLLCIPRIWVCLMINWLVMMHKGSTLLFLCAHFLCLSYVVSPLLKKNYIKIYKFSLLSIWGNQIVGHLFYFDKNFDGFKYSEDFIFSFP